MVETGTRWEYNDTTLADDAITSAGFDYKGQNCHLILMFSK